MRRWRAKNETIAVLLLDLLALSRADLLGGRRGLRFGFGSSRQGDPLAGEEIRQRRLPRRSARLRASRSSSSADYLTP